MPTLPTPASYGLRTPEATRGVVGIAPVKSGLVELGKQITDAAAEETARLEEATAQDARNKLEQKQTELLYDPNNGLYSVTGPAVLHRKLNEEFPQQFAKDIQDISATLPTPRAKAIFQQYADRMQTDTLRHVYTHMASQTDKAYTQIFNDTVANQIDKVARDPSRLDDALATINAALVPEFRRQGLTPEKDAETITRISGQLQGKAVSAAVDAMMAADTVDTTGIEDMLKRYEKVIPPDDLNRMRKEVSAKTAWQHAGQLVDTALAMESQGVSPRDIEAYFSKEATDKATYAQVQERWAYAQRAKKDAQDETAGGFYSRFDAARTPATRQAIITSPEFRALDGKEQSRLQQYMESELRSDIQWARSQQSQAREDIRWKWAQEEHARGSAARQAAQYNNPQVWMEFNRIVSDPVRLAKMTPNQIAAMMPDIGPANVKLLMTAKTQATLKGIQYNLPSSEVNKLLTAVPKADREAANGMVQANLVAWKELNPGRVPTPQEEAKIISNSLATYTQARSYWFDKKVPVYTMDANTDYYALPRGTLPALSVPKSIPRDFAAAAIRNNPAYTTDQIKALWATYQSHHVKPVQPSKGN